MESKVLTSSVHTMNTKYKFKNSGIMSNYGIYFDSLNISLSRQFINFFKERFKLCDLDFGPKIFFLRYIMILEKDIIMMLDAIV